MSSSSIAILFTIINLLYVVVQVLLIVVAAFFWRQYPRPSVYLATMASLELFGSIFQYVIQFVTSQLIVPLDSMLVVSLGALIRLGFHLLAMCFLVMAVYVARRPNSTPTISTSPLSGTPGMENGDQAFILDPKNPYSPPRQPR